MYKKYQRNTKYPVPTNTIFPTDSLHDKTETRYNNIMIIIIEWIKKLFIMFLRGFFQCIRDIDGIFTWLSTFWIKTAPIQGQCKQRGVCCRHIAVGVNHYINESKIGIKIIHWWYSFVYKFKLKGWYKNQQLLIYRCEYLKHNKCSIHWRRPLMCRRYPTPLKKNNSPEFLPGCGFFN